ncbi:MAG: nuclear transport factor 2 family protein [Deltaproteobacteria bacterium]|nr:MAG: nuclear transport factor 2 family protein [Deltaproteobacteria bacterium]
MPREVNRAYWDEYFQTYNQKRYDDLVNYFYTDNPTFQNPKYQLAGRRAIANFFKGQHLEVTEILTPITVIITREVAALELDAVFSSTKDLPQFYVFPLKSGVEVRMGMAAFYHLEGDRIAHARVYWLKPAI